MGERGRGRGGRGAPRGGRNKQQEREEYEAYRKAKKRASKEKKAKMSKPMHFWDPSEKPEIFGQPESFLGSFGVKKMNPHSIDSPKRKRSSSSDSIGDSSESIENEFKESGLLRSKPKTGGASLLARNLLGDSAPDDMQDEEDIIIDENFGEDEMIIEQLREEALFAEGPANEKIKLLEELLASKKAKAEIKNELIVDDVDEGEGEDGDGNGEGEEDEEDLLEEEKKSDEEEEYKNIQDEMKDYEISEVPSSQQEDDDKKMEEIDDFKSISSSDVKMDKDEPSKASEDGRELDVIEEINENEKEDIIMEEENEDFLTQYNRPYELFKRSNKTEIIPKKLLDKFQALLKKIKKRLSKSSAVGDKSKFSETSNMDRVLKNLIETDKKTIANNSGTTAKSSIGPGTYKSSCKAGGDDPGTNLLMGIPGYFDYTMPINCFDWNSMGLLAVAEGDIITFSHNEEILLKSVGIGFTITQLKYHPNNDGFLAVFGNKQCLVVSLDLGSGSSSGEKSFSSIKVLQTIKLDLMLDQIAQDLCIVD